MHRKNLPSYRLVIAFDGKSLDAYIIPDTENISTMRKLTIQDEMPDCFTQLIDNKPSRVNTINLLKALQKPRLIQIEVLHEGDSQYSKHKNPKYRQHAGVGARFFGMDAKSPPHKDELQQLIEFLELMEAEENVPRNGGNFL